MAKQTYLILIRDGRLALSVAAALEDGLIAAGRHGVALVASRRGTDFANRDGASLGCLRQPGVWDAAMPQVVALYEDGLLDMLRSLGLAAYVGVPADEDWRVIRFDDDGKAGAMLLPAATARDLVDAVASYVPWHQCAFPELTEAAGRTAASAQGRGVAARRGGSGRASPPM